MAKIRWKEEIQTEISDLETRIAARVDEIRVMRLATEKLSEELRKAKVIDAMVKGGKVKLASRQFGESEIPDDATGKVVAVRRTRCHVDFAEHGEWDFPIQEIIPADERQLSASEALFSR